MPAFMRQAIACTLAVMAPDTELVFTSRYGDLPTTISMLGAISDHSLLSPAAFSSSVHNASAGIADQILGLKLSHTALAAGADSFGAGLVESWLRLTTGEAAAIALVHGDLAVPEPFAALGDGEAWFVGLRLGNATITGRSFDCAAPFDAGELVAALSDGVRLLQVPIPS
jgi:hypothetical protein